MFSQYKLAPLDISIKITLDVQYCQKMPNISRTQNPTMSIQYVEAPKGTEIKILLNLNPKPNLEPIDLLPDMNIMSNIYKHWHTFYSLPLHNFKFSKEWFYNYHPSPSGLSLPYN